VALKVKNLTYVLKKLKKLLITFWESVFNKVALADASCDHKKSKLHVVAGAEGF
jgi:hypothetical protein